jgi:predicted transcriptional regulator
MKPKRESVEISSDILKVALKGAGKTEIVYKTNLNFRIADKYIKHLVDNGLLKEIQGKRVFYQTTDKGAEFLKNMRSIKMLLG